MNDQKALWNTLSGITSTSLPWLMAGDFNAILYDLDFKGRYSRSYSLKSSFFKNFVNKNNLLDLGFVGSRFTWSNNQLGLACRWARLNRFLANIDWVANFASIANQHLPRSCSDHSPLLLTAHSSISTKKPIFRFDNFWFDYNNCHYCIVNAFDLDNNSSPMHSFHHSITRARANLISWRSAGLRPIDNEIANLEAEIKTIEDQDALLPDPWHHVWLRCLRNRPSALLRQNSIFWAQHAHLQWLNQGDTNSTFFNRTLKARQVKSRIHFLRDNSGNILTSSADIDNEFLTFYRNLWASTSSVSLDHLFCSFPDDFPTLTFDDSDELIKAVTKGEVFRTLRSM